MAILIHRRTEESCGDAQWTPIRYLAQVGGRGVRHDGLLGYECVEEILRHISRSDGGGGDMDREESLSTVWCCSGGDSFLCPWQFLFIGHDNSYSQD